MTEKTAQGAALLTAAAMLAAGCSSGSPGQQQEATTERQITQGAPQNAVAAPTLPPKPNCAFPYETIQQCVVNAAEASAAWSAQAASQVTFQRNFTMMVDLTWVPGQQKPVSTMMPVYGSWRVIDNTTGGVRASALVAPVEATLRTVEQAAQQRIASSTGGHSFACVNNGSNADFSSLGVMSFYEDTREAIGDHDVFLYQQRKARNTGDLGVTLQIEGCSVGGWDSNNGYRTLEGGVGQAVNSKNPRNKIGQDWGREVNSNSVTNELALAVDRGPISISGKLSQTASGAQKGTPGRRDGHPLETDAFAETAVVSYWTTTDSRNYRYSGSSDFQGQVGNSLWEYPDSGAGHVQVMANPYIDYHCSNPFGC